MTDQRPLCWDLYFALQQNYGDVIVSNTGEAFLSHTGAGDSGVADELIIDYPGEYYRVSCPFCHETRQRLWVNHMFGQEHKGRPMLFLAYCFNDTRCMEVPGLARQLYERLFKLQNRQNRRTPPQVQPGIVVPDRPLITKLPGECIPLRELPPNHPAIEYMVNERGYGMDILTHYGVSYCHQADYLWDPTFPGRADRASNRIIIPFFLDGALVAWQGRYIGTPPAKHIPKYYTCPGAQVGSTLYNQDNVAGKPFVVVVEGPTSAWRVGDYAVAMAGDKLRPRQKRLLLEKWSGKPLVFLLEEEGRDRMYEEINDIRAQCANPIATHDFRKGEDPGFFTREAVWGIIRYAAQQAGVCLGV